MQDSIGRGFWIGIAFYASDMPVEPLAFSKTISSPRIAGNDCWLVTGKTVTEGATYTGTDIEM